VIFHICLLIGCLLGTAVPSLAQWQKASNHPIQLDKEIVWQRDPGGELHVLTRGEKGSATVSAPTAPHALRVRTQMVAVTCTVSTPDGTAVPGLRREDFRILDDGAERPIAYFDASTQPASVALVIDASPSVLRDSDAMKQAADALIGALSPLDQAAVVDFSAHTYLQLGFSDVREQIRRAVARVNVKDLLGDTGGSNIYQAVYLAARELFPGHNGRKAILLLTDGQDSGLGLTLDPATAAPKPGQPNNRLTFEDLARSLAAADIQIFAVSTEPRPRIMTPDWLAGHQDSSLLVSDAPKSGVPAYTLYLAELVRRSGGQLYFLRDSASLADIFRRIAQRIGSEYTLGYYLPAVPSNHAAWHRLRIEVLGHPGATIIHRAAYYAPATTP